MPTVNVKLTPGQLDGLLAPIALYPDPLLSLMFPAATYPQDIVAAVQWFLATPNPTEADIVAQGWDDSIKGLVHYPSVLKMMNDRIDWTQALGASFAGCQQDVLHSVQRLRARAQAHQNLQTTPQQQVLDYNGAIRIEPADPEVIYVPQYDPNLVYDSIYPLSFGIGFPIGFWCNNDFDWLRGYIINGGGWYYGWHHPEKWDRWRPGWDRRPAGWVAEPKPWVRAASSSAPRLTPAAVGHLGLVRPHRVTLAHPAPGTARNVSAATAVGKRPAPSVLENVFGSAESRVAVQRAVQRARPTSVQPVAAVRPPAAVHPQPAPRPVAVTPAPRPPVMPDEPAAKVALTPDPRDEWLASRAAPSNVFSAGLASETRAQSSRGNASRDR
ncbi:MAG: DUF3300 domain-containing protein [bacterium]